MDAGKVLNMMRALERHGVDYVVVGGVALNLHGIIRATEDLDFFVRPAAENVERLKRALRSVWDDPCIDEINAQDLCGDYPSVRYGPPDENFFLDILTRLGDAFRFEDLDVQVKDVEGVSVRLATPATLFRMKRDTVRPKDRLDAEVLRSMFGLKDESGSRG